MKPGQELELTATDIDAAGAGVGRCRGVTVHAADLLPGERARVAVEHVSPHGDRHAWARVVERLGAGAPERVEPACPAFGVCGGCAWQHLAYPAQLAHKRERVRRALEQAGLADASALVAEVLPAPAPLGYRNVGKYVVGQAQDGTLVLGSYAPRSHRLIDGAGCRVVAPVIERVRESVRRALARASLPVYRERERTGVWRYVVVREGADGRALVAVVTSGAVTRPDIERALEPLGRDQDIAGVVWLAHDSPSGTILAGPLERISGVSHTRERVADLELRLDIRDFFQVNRAQAARMFREIARLSGLAEPAPGARPWRVLELYCGAGAIGLHLARTAKKRGVPTRVLGIERNPSAVRAAERAARSAGLDPHIHFIAATADSAALFADRLGGAPDLVIVNPPRRGLDHATRAAVSALAPARLVYVSCGPDSLARDLSELCRGPAGFRVHAIQPVDLMPGTPQVETVAALRRE